MNPYQPTLWVNNQTPSINAANLNKIEEGLRITRNGVIDCDEKINIITPQVASNKATLDEITARYYLRDTSSVVNEITAQHAGIAQYTLDAEYNVLVNLTNTGPVTFNLNSFGRYPVVLLDDLELTSGMIKENTMVCLKFLGDKFLLQDYQLNGEILANRSLYNENWIDNSNFEIVNYGKFQTTQGFGSIDRWRLGGNNVNFRMEPIENTDYALKNSRKFLRLTVNSSSNGYAYIQQNIYFGNALSNRPVTLSFNAKADSNKVIGVLIQWNDDVTNQLMSHYIGSFEITSSWKRYSSTFILNRPVLKWSSDQMYSLRFFVTESGASNIHPGMPNNQIGTFDFGEVKLEIGNFATPFKMKPVFEEVSTCYKYHYYNSFSLYFEAKAAGGSCITTFFHPVPMIAPPAFTHLPGGGGTYNLSSIELNCDSLKIRVRIFAAFAAPCYFDYRSYRFMAEA